MNVLSEMEFSFNPQPWLKLQVNCLFKTQDHKICHLPTLMLPFDPGLFLSR